MFVKGMNKDMTCKGMQFKEDEIAEIEGSPVICENGLRYVENPHDVFGYYAPGQSRYFEVEPLGDVSRKQGENEDSKCCTNKLRIGAEVSIKAICQFSVKAFFERFKYKEKIESADTNNAGDYGAANAGYRGAAIVQSEGSSAVGENGVAICMGNGSKAKGGAGAVLVLVERNEDYNVINAKTLIVGKDDIKPDTWYKLVSGEVEESK